MHPFATRHAMHDDPQPSYFPRWTLRTGGVIAPDERLPAAQTLALGVQHVVAMFGATVLAPLLMGFDPNVAILFSGIGTLIFFVLVGGRVPSYLGSSFAFIARRHRRDRLRGQRTEREPRRGARRHHRAPALVYAIIGAVVMVVGYRLDRAPDAAGGHRQRRRGDRTQSRADRRSRASPATRSTRGSASRRSSPSGSSPCARRGSRAACRCCSAASPAICSTRVCTNGAGPRQADRLRRRGGRAWIGLPRFHGAGAGTRMRSR